MKINVYYNAEGAETDIKEAINHLFDDIPRKFVRLRNQKEMEQIVNRLIAGNIVIPTILMNHTKIKVDTGEDY